MTFEDAINSLAAEFGTTLQIDDGAAVFTVHDDDDADGIAVVLRPVENRECAVISADLGALPSDGAADAMLKMLEANHLFTGTGGATLSVEGDRAKLERCIPLQTLARGEAAPLLAQFLATARKWRPIGGGEVVRW